MIDFNNEVIDGIADLKNCTLFLSEKSNAKELLGDIKTALYGISKTFEKTVNYYGHFLNNNIERPSMYEHRFMTALQNCVTNFEALYDAIIDRNLLFQYTLPGLSSSLKVK